MNRLTEPHRRGRVRRTPRTRSGYTLVEMVVGTLSFVVLLAGLISSLLIATSASDPNIGPSPSTVDASMAAEQMAAELCCLLSVVAKTDKSIEFTVADRNNDSASETIKYDWSGTTGAPLTYQFNGGTVQTFVDDVHVFALSYSGPPAPSDNLLQNPDFESGITDWSIASGNLEASTDVAFSGASSLKVTNRDSPEHGPVQQIQNVLESGETYEISVWVKTMSGNEDFFIVLSTVDSGGSDSEFIGGQVNVGTEWTQVTATLTPTWSGTLAAAEWTLWTDSSGSGSGDIDFYMDKATLEDVNGADNIHLQRLTIDLQIGSDAKTSVGRPVEIFNSPVVPES